MSTLTKKDVLSVAYLARLELEEQQLETVQKDLESILTFVEQLEGVPTEGVIPMTSVVEVSQNFREDKVTDGDIRDQILQNAPEPVQGFFSVPKVVE